MYPSYSMKTELIESVENTKTLLSERIIEKNYFVEAIVVGCK